MDRVKNGESHRFSLVTNIWKLVLSDLILFFKLYWQKSFRKSQEFSPHVGVGLISSCALTS